MHFDKKRPENCHGWWGDGEGRRGDFAGKGRECIREEIMGRRKVKMGGERKRREKEGCN